MVKSVRPPVPTGDALLRLEQLSANTSSTTWYDISATGNNGTAADANMFSDFSFDGIVDEVVTASTEPSHDFNTPWTLTFWYKRDTSTVSGYSTIMQTRIATGGWLLRDPSDPAKEDYDFGITKPIFQPIYDTIKGDDANWHFAAITWTPGATKVMRSYVDGVLYQTGNVTQAAVAGDVLQIGKGNFYRFTGNMDTVRSYPRVLSVDEIVRDYYAGKASHP
jgi:hypothetical protein